jgi:hypothetical protein
MHGVAVIPADIDYYAGLVADRLKQAGSHDAGSTLH